MMRNLTQFVVIGLLMINSGYSQNLLNERIRKIPNRKKSIFLDKGVFHNGGPKEKSALKAIRHSFKKDLNFERVVMDFETKEVPRIYGHISTKSKKLYIDLFKTKLNKGIGSFGTSKFVKAINFYPIDEKTLSIEIDFKDKVNVDIFSLQAPGRLVIDIKR